jgi:hypothetical protein
MRSGPPFSYARRQDGRRVAYQVVGDGDLDLVFLFDWPTHLGLMWENPSFAGFLGKLSSFWRLLLFDRVGGGLSDRGGAAPVFEDEMDDIRTVLAAVGSERAALFGCHAGGRLALLMAATYPDQVSAVVTFGSHPATLRDDDYPWGSTPEQHEQLLTLIGDGPTVDEDMVLSMVAPSEAADVNASRYLAERIPGARFMELPGDAQFPFFGDQDRVVARTQEFLTGATPVVESDRVLATLLFTDIVDSTRLAAEPGDRRWHRVLVDHQEAVRRQLGRAGAGEVLCSRTVKDLVAGSGSSSADRGTHSLKGVPDDWQLYAVELAEG